jgi:hypothetical protein
VQLFGDGAEVAKMSQLHGIRLSDSQSMRNRYF